METHAVIIRPANIRTSNWIRIQADQIRKNGGRRMGYGPFTEAILNGIVEAGISFDDCCSMADVAARVVRLLNARFRPVLKP